VIGAFEICTIAQVLLGVKEDNQTALRVYEQAGFQAYQPAPTKNGHHIMIIFPTDLE
jgi:ribosomal protein S18 acetylase RimI-like enzyme